MAPTEILAEQHFMNISRLLQPSRFRVALLTGSTAKAARREQLAQVASGAIHLVVERYKEAAQALYRRVGFVAYERNVMTKSLD
jgi:ATP-dependent DNA helicase RecG